MEQNGSKRIRERKTQILTEWEKEVRKHIGESNFHTRMEFFDHLPEFLDGIAERLDRRVKPANMRLHTRVAREYGLQRANLRGYSIDEVIYEYNILRKVMLALLEEDFPLTIRDRDEILNCIFFAIEKAVYEFMQNKEGKRNEAMHSLRESHATLGKEVEAQAKKIAEVTEERDQSEETKSNLEQEKALRETFVDTLTHDLRSPLTSAKITAQMLARSPERAQENPELIIRILSAIERVDRMIQDLLDANRVRAGQPLPLKKKKMDLVVAARTVCEEMSSAHGQQFRIQAKGPVNGCWDEDGVRRILENLMKNAHKYGASNSPVTTCISNDGKQAKLEIHNFGEPIPLLDQSKLFQPFQRSQSAQISGQGGWGLGLTLVKGMAEAHDGSVTCAKLNTR